MENGEIAHCLLDTIMVSLWKGIEPKLLREIEKDVHRRGETLEGRLECFGDPCGGMSLVALCDLKYSMQLNYAANRIWLFFLPRDLG